ncbi:TetR/AcrR family transcriptional regulator [Kribbella sp. NPDC026611]|uniref:TetR/AcrR family transcriptional regulator n=1 Tax=Kribbella sp. NPDC026611 TaxID=3154911 RepID=UPI0033D112A1
MLTAKGTATRGRIIDAAAAEIRDRGITAVTLDDIGRRSRTGKSQLFHYFPDGKEQLLLAVAEREADRVLEDQEPQLGRLTSWAAWREWRDVLVERYRRQGVNCPLGVLITEVGRHAPAAQAVTGKLLAQWEQRIRAGVEGMQAAGEIRSDVDPARASALLMAAIQGGVAILMSSGSSTHLEYALDSCLDYLQLSTGG